MHFSKMGWASLAAFENTNVIGTKANKVPCLRIFKLKKIIMGQCKKLKLNLSGGSVLNQAYALRIRVTPLIFF